MNSPGASAGRGDEDKRAALGRFTTRYVPREDRIRLSGEMKDGPPVVLWLTQRQLTRLLPRLFQWLDKQVPDGLRAETIQELRQQAARAELEPQAPVRVAPDAQAWLVESVDIKTAARSLRLRLKGADEARQVTLALRVKPLRQWLGILHDQWCKAEWPPAVWPQWITEARQPQGEGRATMLH